MSDTNINSGDECLECARLEKQIDRQAAEIERLKNQREDDLYLEFGDGKIYVMAGTDSNGKLTKLILSKRLGTGKVGEKHPILKEGDLFSPSENDVVVRFKNIESFMVVKETLDIIEQSLKGT